MTGSDSRYWSKHLTTLVNISRTSGKVVVVLPKICLSVQFQEVDRTSVWVTRERYEL